jgi:DNA-binding NarL/FixJ family response regulator
MTVLVADALPMVRDALRALLEARGLTIAGEAADGAAALAFAATRPVELAVIDAALPGVPGLEVVRRLRTTQPRCGCVVTSVARSGAAVREALEAGARGLLDRSSGAVELFAALDAARAERRYVATSLRSQIADAVGSRRALQPARGMLTERQREVLQLIAAGCSTAEIAERLRISTKTVETHRAKLMARVGIHKASSLVRFAIRQGIIEA